MIIALCYLILVETRNYFGRSVLDNTAKQTKIKTMPTQPIGANCSPTKRTANKAATSGSNKVSVVAVLAEIVFSAYPNSR